MNPKIFFGELKRRNVYKVGVAYAVVAWLLIQVATQVFPFLDIPTWMIRLIIIMSALGFPIALIIAWAFELTPEGIKRTEDADAARQRSRGGVWIVVIVVAAALSLGPFFLGRYTAGRATSRPVTQPEARPGFQSEAAKTFSEKSIAVPPLVNTSGDASNEYFSDGLSEELIAVLAKIPELKVIGRSSSFFFKGKVSDSAAIGQKLGVANLIEGSVRKQGDRVNDFIAKYSNIGPFQIAVLYAIRKEPDDIFKWLDNAYATRDPGLTQLAVTPFFLPYMNDQRLVALGQKLNVQVRPMPAKP
jgi:serine/threonine-protein kinase